MSTASAWALVVAAAAVTAAIKAAGPIALGGRPLPPWFNRIIRLLAPALLAALVCTAALAQGDRLAAGADTAGVAAAAVVLLRGGGVVAGVLVAAAVTAGLRALT